MNSAYFVRRFDGKRETGYIDLNDDWVNLDSAEEFQSAVEARSIAWAHQKNCKDGWSYDIQLFDSRKGVQVKMELS